MSTIAVAMSGGVDSSVAAWLLARAGHRVIGFSLRLHRARPGGAPGCCSPEDFLDARRVACEIGIPYYVLNFEEVFARTVVDRFVADFLAGRTPSPCVLCNTHVKFRHFLDRALALGADAVATGHYARRTGTGPFSLRAASDPDKDQSYFLFGLGQDDLARTRFPLGELTKVQVREIAASAGLATARKAESQELCFAAPGRHADLVAERAGATPPPGPIRDGSGRVLGRHRGLHRYTVGQRHGLGIAAPRPLYVRRLDVLDNTLWVDEADGLLETRFEVAEPSWVAGAPPALPCRVSVKIRSRHRPAAAELDAGGDGRLVVTLDEPQRAIAPGQAAVFYAGDEVLGGGFIATAGGTGPPAAGSQGAFASAKM